MNKERMLTEICDELNEVITDEMLEGIIDLPSPSSWRENKAVEEVLRLNNRPLNELEMVEWFKNNFFANRTVGRKIACIEISSLLGHKPTKEVANALRKYYDFRGCAKAAYRLYLGEDC